MLLVSLTGKTFYIKNTNQDFHSQYGYVKADELKKARPGTKVSTNTGHELIVLEPGFIDLYRRIRRAPQIIPLKDIGSIITQTGIGKDSVVVDAGTGSGGLALFLANIVKKVITYEIRDDFASVAEENVRFLNLKNVTVKRKDVYNGIDEKQTDLVTLDLAEPWKAVDAAHKSLKVGGFIVSYSPTTPQVSDFVEKVNSTEGLQHLSTAEIFEREWEVDKRKIRPRSQAIGHSGFLSFARKLAE